MNEKSFQVFAVCLFVMAHFRFAVQGGSKKYDVMIDNKKETCAGKYKLYVRPNHDKEKCEQKCNEHLECMFFFLTDNKWCVLYKECADKRTPKRIGTTYKKNECFDLDSYCKRNMERENQVSFCDESDDYIIEYCQKSCGLCDLYTHGNKGEDKCPPDYYPITTPSLCEAAAQQLGFRWSPTKGRKNENSICNYCGGCHPKEVRLSSDHGRKAYWICTKEKPFEKGTCDDGKQNGHEDGVDCGGECRPCDQCKPNPCKNGGECVETSVYGFYCNCPDAWLGDKLCQVPVHGQCVDTNDGATDSQGNLCNGAQYYGANPRFCGAYDDHDFSAKTMCCVCGGGQRA